MAPDERPSDSAHLALRRHRRQLRRVGPGLGFAALGVGVRMATVKSLASIIALISFAGIALVDVFSNHPPLFVADPSVGRVCPAIYLNRFSSHFFYYTDRFDCAVSWGFAATLFAAAIVLAIVKFKR